VRGSTSIEYSPPRHKLKLRLAAWPSSRRSSASLRKGGAAATQVQLADTTGPCRCDAVCQAPPRGSGSAGTVSALSWCLVMILLQRAVVAQRLAKRDVHVERQAAAPARPRRWPALLPAPGRSRPAEGLDKPVCRGVRGVARAGDIKPAQQASSGHEVGGMNGMRSLNTECAQTVTEALAEAA